MSCVIRFFRLILVYWCVFFYHLVCKIHQKIRGHVLTTKICYLEKPDHPVCQTRPSGFGWDGIWAKLARMGLLWLLMNIMPRCVVQVMENVFWSTFGQIDVMEQREENYWINGENTWRWSQMVDLKPPWWSPRRDDQNRHMDRMIRRPNEEVVLFEKSPRLKNQCPILKQDGPGFSDSTPVETGGSGFLVTHQIVYVSFEYVSLGISICIRPPTGIKSHGRLRHNPIEQTQL